jgi:hypothetical protein
MTEDTTSPPTSPVTPEGGEKKGLPKKSKTGESTPPEGEAQQKEVAELRAQVEELTTKLGQTQKDLEQAKNMQRIADKTRKKERIAKEKLQKTLQEIRDTGEIPPEGIEETETPILREEKIKARIAIQNILIASPAYQKLLQEDVTLREVMINNPLALISEWEDAEDAVAQVKDKLDARLSSPPQPGEEGKKEKEKEGKKFEAGPVQPPGTTPPKTETPSQKALKKGDIEGSIKSKIRFTGLEK